MAAAATTPTPARHILVRAGRPQTMSIKQTE